MASVTLQPANDSIVPAVVTPHPASVSTTSTLQQPPAPIVISISCEVKKQIIDHTKQKITWFLLTSPAMATTDDEKIQLVSQAISELTLAIPSMNAFMHRYMVDTNGNVMILDGVLDHPFILNIVVYIEQLNYAIAVAGAIMKLVLHEQLPHPPVILLLMQLNGKDAFNNIVHHIGNLSDVQKDVFCNYKSYIAIVGRSQQQSNSVLAQLDFMITPALGF
ncbi:hypothetical protein BDR07DRAFT_1489729 [Suillus spraguei]|nr:hypothetical protein BDR07DRAFT_1489729 [Suillus spraguei]